MPARDKVTVLIPCRDEERHILACIESARLVADEILVADSGSLDGTLEIVRSQPDVRLIEHPWIGFAPFKNWAIPQATHPWVLIVDADERVTAELAEEIHALLAHPAEEIDGYWIYRRNFFFGKEIRHCGWNTDDVCRLIRRDRCRYVERPVHEEMDLDRRRTRWLKQRLLHDAVNNYDHFLTKRVGYTRLSAEHAWEEGKRASFSSLFFRPLFRFLQLYLLRLGFLDGLAGLQVCMFTAFFNTFARQARLWEMEQRQSGITEMAEPSPRRSPQQLAERPAA